MIGADAARLVISTAALALLSACGSGNGTAEASCALPYLDDHPPSVDGPRSPRATVPAGGAVTVYGHGYTTSCNDTGEDEPLVPLSPVHLTLTLPDGTSTDLGTYSADGDDMVFKARVTVPADTKPGEAVVRDDLGYGSDDGFRILIQAANGSSS